MNCRAIALLGAAVLFSAAGVKAQTIRYDVLPRASLRDSVSDPTGAGLEIRAWTLELRIPLPRLVSTRRTVVNHEVAVRYFNADYVGWDPAQHGPTPFDRALVVSWSLSLEHQLSNRWSLLAYAQPQTDLRAEGLIAFVRAGPRVTWGLGAALSLNFETSLPIPIVVLNWNNGHDLRVESILPAFLEFWYVPGGHWDIGFTARLSGSRYTAKSERFASAADPVLEYADPTIGPSLRWHAFPGAFLQVDGGVLMGSRFEFKDGDTSLLNLGVRERSFLRVSAQLGFAERWWCAGVC